MPCVSHHSWTMQMLTRVCGCILAATVSGCFSLSEKPVSHHTCISATNLESINAVELTVDSDDSSRLSVDELKAQLKFAKFLESTDPILVNWNYSPWMKGQFSTREGRHELTLFRGGLGMLSCRHRLKNFFLLPRK